MPIIDLNGLGHFKDKENAMVADKYSATKTYAVGDYCYYNGTLYRCTTAITTAEAWTVGHWTAAKLAADVTSQSEQIGELKNATNGIKSTIFTDETQIDNLSYNASRFGKTNKPVLAFLPANTWVKSLSLLMPANTAPYVDVELWEETNGTYSKSKTFQYLSTESHTSGYQKVNYPEIICNKNAFITYKDTSSSGVVRNDTDASSTLYVFPYDSETITFAAMTTVTRKIAVKIDYLTDLEDSAKDFVIVDQNGSGNYTTVIDAITNEPENTVIMVKPGVYNQDMTSCLKKRIILIGTDRNQCIIRDTDGRYGHHPLYISCGYFENLTIVAPYVSGESHEIGASGESSDNGSYAVHIDTDNDYAVGKQCEFHHCNISSDFFPAVGLGLRKNATFIFDDCKLENNQIATRGNYTSDGTLGALFFHDTNGEGGNQYIEVKDCMLTSKLENAMCMMQRENPEEETAVFCNFINNVLFSDVGGYTDTVWFRRDPLNPSTGKFSIVIGYGNSISTLNNNT